MNMDKKKILYFEPDPMMADLISTNLRKGDFEVTYYSYPPEKSNDVINIVQAVKPDLIVTDIIMPNMDGFTLTKNLKSNKETSSVPIIAYTNLGQPKEIQKGLQLGITGWWIMAEHTPGEFVKKIRKFVQTLS